MTANAASQTPLSRAIIVDTAMALADAAGLDAMSMRKVADALGAGTMSLYNHVADKDDLQGAMLERAVAEVQLPAVPGDWRTGIRHTATSLRRVLSTHPWACDLWPSTFPGPARKQLMEGLLRCFREAGFSPRLAHHAFHAVDLYVVGHVQQTVSFDLGDDRDALAARFLDETPVEEFPYLIEHFQQHEGDGSDDDFTFMLDLILDGLAHHLH